MSANFPPTHTPTFREVLDAFVIWLNHHEGNPADLVPVFLEEVGLR